MRHFKKSKTNIVSLAIFGLLAVVVLILVKMYLDGITNNLHSFTK